MDHINNRAYRILKRDPNTKSKDKIVKQLKASKDNDFIDNKFCYYLKPSDFPVPTFFSQPTIHQSEVSIRPIIS